MSDCCRAKQKEITIDNKQIDRCVNPKSPVHLSVVQPSFCSLCPVRQACSSSEKVNPGRSMMTAPGFPLCEHRVWQNNSATCGVTGLPVTEEQCGRCEEEVRDRVATLPDKLKGYASAIKRWVAAGRPTRSEEEQKRILEEHCLKCEMYDREKHSCKNCGCSLAQTGNPLTNKLAMGTEKCPLGRWE